MSLADVQKNYKFDNRYMTKLTANQYFTDSRIELEAILNKK